MLLILGQIPMQYTVIAKTDVNAVKMTFLK